MEEAFKEKFIKERKREIKSHDMKQLSWYRDELRKNPRLAYLFVELTNCCNLYCLHCGSSCRSTKRTFIDTDLLLRALETVAEDFTAGSVMICLSGGEPMLHREFFRIVQKIVELGFPWGITTNGTLIDAKNAERLGELRLRSISISIDGLEKCHDRLRQVPGAFKKAVTAVQNLKAADIPVQVTSVIHKENFHELEALYDFMCRLDIDSWRVINIEPIGRALQNEELALSEKQMEALLSFIRAKRYAKTTPMEVCFGCSHYLSYDYEHEVRDQYFICGAGIYVGGILCNGDIFSCLDIERRPELIQGNIKSDRFSEVWHNRFKEFRIDRTQFCAQCVECDEKEFCCGDSTHTWDFEKKEPRFCILKEKHHADLSGSDSGSGTGE